jgi:hypothetical protein
MNTKLILSSVAGGLLGMLLFKNKIAGALVGAAAGSAAYYVADNFVPACVWDNSCSRGGFSPDYSPMKMTAQNAADWFHDLTMR